MVNIFADQWNDAAFSSDYCTFCPVEMATTFIAATAKTILSAARMNLLIKNRNFAGVKIIWFTKHLLAF